MSLSTDRAFHRATAAGAFSGADGIGYEGWNAIAGLSKRELIEVGLRLGAICADDPDESKAGQDRFWEEWRALKQARII